MGYVDGTAAESQNKVNPDLRGAQAFRGFGDALLEPDGYSIVYFDK